MIYKHSSSAIKTLPSTKIPTDNQDCDYQATTSQTAATVAPNSTSIALDNMGTDMFNHDDGIPLAFENLVKLSDENDMRADLVQ